MYPALLFCPLFRGVTVDVQETLLKQYHHKIIHFKSNELIVQSNDVCHSLMIILEGSVKTEMNDSSGKIIKIEDMSAGQPLAPAFLFGMKNFYPVNVIGNTEGQMIVFNKDILIQMMQENAQILNNYLNIICTRSQFLADKIKFLSFRTIKEKIVLFLLEHAQNETYRIIDINQSQQELADLFGVTRPSLARTLSELEDQQLIKIERKQLTILDFNKLKALLK